MTTETTKFTDGKSVKEQTIEVNPLDKPKREDYTRMNQTTDWYAYDYRKWQEIFNRIKKVINK